METKNQINNVKILFEQYKLYINGIENISNRRDNANKYFISINTGIVASLGFLITDFQVKIPFFLLLILLFGMVISVIFWFLLNSYAQLNSAKFKIVHIIESKLPIELYKKEWNLLGEGKDYKKYYPFSHIEKIIPCLFFVFYFVGFIYFSIISI